DDAEVLGAGGPQGVDGGAMGEKHVVHGTGSSAQVAIAGRVNAEEMTEEGHAPGLVDGRGGLEAIAEFLADQGGIVGEPAGNIPVHPAAAILQGGRQIPMVERGVGFYAALEHAVDQAVVEVDALLVDGAGALGDEARPGEGKAIGVKAAVADEV